MTRPRDDLHDLAAIFSTSSELAEGILQLNLTSNIMRQYLTRGCSVPRENVGDLDWLLQVKITNETALGIIHVS